MFRKRSMNIANYVTFERRISPYNIQQTDPSILVSDLNIKKTLAMCPGLGIMARWVVFLMQFGRITSDVVTGMSVTQWC